MPDIQMGVSPRNSFINLLDMLSWCNMFTIMPFDVCGRRFLLRNLHHDASTRRYDEGLRSLDNRKFRSRLSGTYVFKVAAPLYSPQRSLMFNPHYIHLPIERSRFVYDVVSSHEQDAQLTMVPRATISAVDVTDMPYQLDLRLRS